MIYRAQYQWQDCMTLPVSLLTNGKIYARPYLSGLLSTNAYKSICLLCEIADLIAKPIYNIEDITTLY